MPKSAARQTNSNKSDILGRSLFRRIHIADIGAVSDTSLARGSLADADIATAVDVRTGRTEFRKNLASMSRQFALAANC